MANRFVSHSAIPILIAFLVLGAGTASAPDTPRVIGICLDCHEDKESSLAATPHSLAGEAKDGAGAKIVCTDCHSGDRRHWEEDPDQYPMKSPAKLSARDQATLCAKCHQTSHQQNMAERNVHMASDVNCSSCHSVHAAKTPILLKAEERELCATCHRGVEGAFAKPYRHPVAEGIVKCSECHMTLDETRRELSLNGTNACMKCHAEFQGPFPYEHQATVDYSTEEGGCVSCHEPHGSYLPRMLRQPYEPPHFQLCTQCHAVPSRHNNNLQHGTAWAGLSCSECHTDVHGSYSNRLFLSETLVGQGCFTAGCHQP
ncbi:MAG TPA: cytochrome c3 family protein [Candidatus Eisenbacteria bacterium]|nr:cytochrome c3 family protein [Candidatus Eisenbacteria bacterium]